VQINRQKGLQGLFVVYATPMNSSLTSYNRRMNSFGRSPAIISNVSIQWVHVAARALFAVCMGSSVTCMASGKSQSVIAQRVATTGPSATLTLSNAHHQRVLDAIKTPSAILPLAGKLSIDQREAQRIALEDTTFLEGTRELGTNAPLRNEIFGIYSLRDSDIATPALEKCRNRSKCFRVEQYQYAWNDTKIAFVDVTEKRVLSVQKLVDTQPDIPERLERVAAEIVANSSLVEKTLGRKPSVNELTMTTTKTALNRTRCERSRHLCVAPTIVEGNSALFIIVDLTTYRVVGARWTKLGRAAAAPSERRLQNEGIAKDYCDKAVPVTRGDWKFDFQITSSDGVKVANVSYKDKPFLRSVKTVDWHVSYSWKQGFGYSDAVGCPVFSQAAVVAVDPPQFLPLSENGKEVGFSLIQDFRGDQWPRPCNYYYRLRFDFYEDGRFRPVSASFGRGCGDDGVYRPVTRIAFADVTNVSEWRGGQWSAWRQEDYRLASKMTLSPSGALFSFGGGEQSYELIPNTGQWDASRGDNPYVYITVSPPGRDEGESDLPPIGTCCNNDYKQGPEKFILPTPEPIDKDPLVLWYVAQLKNDGTKGREYCWADFVLEAGVYIEKAYPCYSGPMIQPVRSTTTVKLSTPN
jgi:hypothetical protein